MSPLAIMPKIAAGLGLATLAVSAFAAVQTWRLDGWRDLAKARGTALDQIEIVQQEQNARIIAWAKDIEARSKRIADNADRNYQAGYAAASDAAERYIAAHRVRPQADPGGAIRPPAIAVPDSPEGGDGPGPAAELVAVPADDVRICTINTKRLEEVRLWALELGR